MFLEPWRFAWRNGFVPELTTHQLEVLREALANNDPHLIQGSTLEPEAVAINDMAPVRCACVAAYCGWKGEGLTLVKDAEAFFADLCARADKRLNYERGHGCFLNWYDDNPRQIVFHELLKEVDLALKERQNGVARTE